MFLAKGTTKEKDPNWMHEFFFTSVMKQKRNVPAHISFSINRLTTDSVETLNCRRCKLIYKQTKKQPKKKKRNR